MSEYLLSIVYCLLSIVYCLLSIIVNSSPRQIEQGYTKVLMRGSVSLVFL